VRNSLRPLAGREECGNDEELKYYETKIDELDVSGGREEMKAAYWELREPAMLPVDEDGTLKGSTCTTHSICVLQKVSRCRYVAYLKWIRSKVPKTLLRYYSSELVHSTGVGEGRSYFVCQELPMISRRTLLFQSTMKATFIRIWRRSPTEEPNLAERVGAARHHYCGEGPGNGANERSH
jgi:hypothetical protein